MWGRRPTVVITSTKLFIGAVTQRAKGQKTYVTAAVHTSNDLKYFVHESTKQTRNSRIDGTLTSCADASVLFATLLERRLDRHLVLNGRLVHVSEFFENLRGHRLQLPGSQVLPLMGLSPGADGLRSA